MPAVPRHWLYGLPFGSGIVFLTIVSVAGCGRTLAVVPQTANQPPFFTLRVAFNESASGRQRVEYGDTTYFLEPEVLLSDDDLLCASSVTRPDTGLLLHVRLRPESGQRLYTATAGRVGKQIAMLLDSRVWHVARIAAPLGAVSSMTVATGATGKDAQRIGRQIRSRWPDEDHDPLSCLSTLRSLANTR